MWQGMRDVWISSKQTGQLDLETFSTHCKTNKQSINNWVPLLQEILLSSPCGRPFSIAKVDTYCRLRSGKIVLCHPLDKFHTLRSGTDSCPRHRIDYKSNTYTVNKNSNGRVRDREIRNAKTLTLPNRIPQLSQLAWTRCRVSHSVQISSVTVLRLK